PERPRGQDARRGSGHRRRGGPGAGGPARPRRAGRAGPVRHPRPAAPVRLRRHHGRRRPPDARPGAALPPAPRPAADRRPAPALMPGRPPPYHHSSAAAYARTGDPMRLVLVNTLSLGFAAALLALVGNAAVAHRNIGDLADTSRLVARSHAVQDALEKLL